MDKNTKWLAAIYQRFSIQSRLSCTQIISLHLNAGSAKEAELKVRAWLKTSGIEDAYVSEICRDGLDEITLEEEKNE